MKRAWRILLIVGACAVLAIIMALVWPGEREPEYKGRKLSEWTHRAFIPKLQTADKAEQVKAVQVKAVQVEAERIEAVHHIGTNALPYLLKWIEGGELPRTYSKPDLVAIKVMTKETALRWLNYRQRKFYRAVEAQWAFEVLGTNASPAVPELVRLSHSTNSFVADAAADALRRIEQKVTPPSGDFTKDPNAPAWTHWTNSVGGAAAAIGHVWKTNSKVQVPEEGKAPGTDEGKAPTTNIQHPDKLQ